MGLEKRLADELIRSHTEHAAHVLEQLGSRETSRALKGVAIGDATSLFGRLSPNLAVEALNEMAEDRAAVVLATLPLAVAARLARRLTADRAEALLGRMPARRARATRALIRFPENCAGALMDPNAMALPEAISVREALDRLRDSPEDSGDNVYVVDSEQKLVGVISMRSLLVAKRQVKLCDLMTRSPPFLEANTDRSAVVSHRGWLESHSLPVVDADGAFVGAVGYRTLRELETLLRGGRGRDADAPQALGNLFAVGAQGVFDALTAAHDHAEDA